MAAGAVPAPIEIPGQSTCRKREPSGAKQRPRQSPALAVAASVVLVTLVVMEICSPYDASDEANAAWGFWVLRLVFPSQHVTWAKLLGLALGFVLTTSYFLSSQTQLASAEKMLIHSANALVSPLRRSPPKPMANDPNAPTPTGKTAAAWLASRCHSFLDTDESGESQAGDANDEIPQLKIRDECKAHNTTPEPSSASSEFESVNRAQPLAFESEYFRGHVLFMVKDTTRDSPQGTWAHLFGTKKRMLWVQVQGRFTRPLPPRTVTYLATELPEPDGFRVAFLTRQLVNLLVALVKTLVPTAHIAFGETATSEGERELPHAAFPLYQTADEFVVTDADGENASEKTPSFGQEVFGESAESKKARAATPVGMEPAIRTDAVYSFQFYTMYSNLAQWQMVNVPGMPDMDLKRFCGQQPIRLAIYAMATPGLHPGVLCDLPHKAKDKAYIFCFSMHHNPSGANGDADLPFSPLLLSPTPSHSRTSPPPLSSSPLRWRSVSCDQPDAIARQQRREAEAVHDHEMQSAVERRPQPRIRAPSSVRSMTSLERAADLCNWEFSLPVWIERVDPTAGNRKIAYLLVVQEKRATARRRCVVRSALTIKNALLLLDAKETETGGEHSRAFKKLLVESREFLYESISKETDQVAQALQAIAATSVDQATPMDTDKKAMLFNCLMSESQLPCIRSFQDIGVQLPKAKRDRMDIIFETGVYRMPDPRFLRQEWFILTTAELQFFRSFTLKPGKTVPLSHVLGIRSVDDVPFFERSDLKEDVVSETESNPRQTERDAAKRSTNRWFCVEIHVLSEIVTLFLDSADDRALCVASLTQLIKLKSGGSASNALARLPPCRSLDAVATPVCCNQRKKLPVGCSGTQTTNGNPVELAEQMVARGLCLLQRPRQQAVASDVVAFLDAVDMLCEVDFSVAPASSTSATGDATTTTSPASYFATNESRVAFALNLFHGLLIHAWLLFGDVRTHAQWKKRKSMVFYTIGNPRLPASLVHITLADIEHTLLQGRHAPGDEPPRSAVKLPACWLPIERDFRTSLALQTNSGPSSSAVGTLCVYHAGSVSKELNEACAVYLESELVVDDLHGVIQLPKVCEWNLDDFLKGCSPIVQPGSRAFFCLQKLLPLMNEPQHDRIQHLLLGAGKEYQIRFSARFWTQTLRSLPAEVINGSVNEAATTHNTRDHLTVALAGGTPLETKREGIPRSKSALQFFQSLF